MAHGRRLSHHPPALLRGALVWVAACGALTPACFDPSGVDEEDTDAVVGTTGVGDEATEGDVSTGDAGDDGAVGSTGVVDDDGDAADQAEACAEYCGLVGDHCGDELAQYAGTALCEATCAQMPLGTPEDTLGNTVGCRTFHALLAAESADPHCRHAGPAGDGTCGANCESFCSLTLQTCAGELAPYPDADSCIAACEGFAAEPPYSADAPDADTFACRMHHLTLAAVQPDVHCGHIGETSPVCVD